MKSSVSHSEENLILSEQILVSQKRNYYYYYKTAMYFLLKWKNWVYVWYKTELHTLFNKYKRIAPFVTYKNFTAYAIYG